MDQINAQGNAAIAEGSVSTTEFCYILYGVTLGQCKNIPGIIQMFMKGSIEDILQEAGLPGDLVGLINEELLEILNSIECTGRVSMSPLHKYYFQLSLDETS